MKRLILISVIVTAVAACGNNDGKEPPKETRKVVPIVGKYELTIAICKGMTVVPGANCSDFGHCSSLGGSSFRDTITNTSSPTKVAIDSLGHFEVISQTRIGSPEDHVPNPGPKNTSPDYSYWPECVAYFERESPYIGDWTGRRECGGYTMDGTLVCLSSNEWSLHRRGDL